MPSSHGSRPEYDVSMWPFSIRLEPPPEPSSVPSTFGRPSSTSCHCTCSPSALDDLGIERIEAGFPRVSEEDRRAVELIRDAGLDAEIWGFSRAVEADVEALVELGVTASVIESPISDRKLDALGVSREEMLERIRGAVSSAAGRGVTVAYFGVDGTRADPAFFDAAYDAAVEAGAREGGGGATPRGPPPGGGAGARGGGEGG